jgi:hypothetical protein
MTPDLSTTRIGLIEDFTLLWLWKRSCQKSKNTRRAISLSFTVLFKGRDERLDIKTPEERMMALLYPSRLSKQYSLQSRYEPTSSD